MGKVKKAVVLAAGLGTRLRYYTEYGLDKERLIGTITLDKQDGTGTRKVWLVKWASPFRKPTGMKLLFR